MKIGIDSYCYHKFFGEVYPTEEAPKIKMSFEDFLNRAAELKVDGVSLETCFIPSFDDNYLKKIREIIDKNNFKVVVAWGHPNGLEGGNNVAALKDMYGHFKTCKLLGTDLLRMVGSSLSYRNEPHLPQINRLTKMMKEAVKLAEDSGVKLAIENHFDFTTDEILTIITNVDSPYFGLTFDTGNCLRNGDDPVKSARVLARYTFATHLKDVEAIYGWDPKDWMFFSCTPIGQGIVNIEAIIVELEKSGYKGFMAVEIDNLHPKYKGEVDKAVAESIDFLNLLRK